MFEGFQRHRIDTGEATIHCVTAGNGPPLLLLHGYPQNLAMWAKTAPILAGKFTVVCADLRGYGDSSKPKCAPDNGNYAFRAMAADQVAVMRKLGFERFHVVGHDRGGRTAHRMALDHPQAVASLSVLDIVPTWAMFNDVTRKIAGTYWHWYFLSQPTPFPEHMIGLDPDFFFETCLVGWGATKVEDFDADMMADYRRCWRNPEMIHGSCSDYRAAATIDMEHDGADVGTKVACPTMVFYGANGTMAKNFDLAAEWRKRCTNVTVESLPGGHFFIDQMPEDTARIIARFVGAVPI
ncbi:MAG TPA: alpha/beta hydrolase [Burkholderiales bacterium]|nr:alpha/beta hydrolase [Burkholderiales bacterium]